MESVGAFEAKTNLSKLLDRVADGESLTITRHGTPVARLVPVDGRRTRARRAAQRIIARRRQIETAPLAELLETIHEGHKY